MLFTTLSAKSVQTSLTKRQIAQRQGRLKWLIVINRESEKKQKEANGEMKQDDDWADYLE